MVIRINKSDSIMITWINISKMASSSSFSEGSLPYLQPRAAVKQIKINGSLDPSRFEDAPWHLCINM
jgi:hypothetical protein